MQEVGKYLPQFYKGAEMESLLAKLTGSKGGSFKIGGDRFLKRKLEWEKLNLTAEGRMKLQEMGAIRDPGYSAPRAILDVGSDVATSRFSSRVAADPTLASVNPVEGWVQVGSNKKYGDLAGKYVHPDVYEHVKQLAPWFGDSKIGKLYDQMMGMWKKGKTVFNPATHARNMTTQAWFFEGATGRSWLDPREWNWFKSGVGDFVKGDELYKALDQRGLFRTPSSAAAEHRNELKATMLAIEGGGDTVLEKVLSAPGRLYRAEDDLNRYLLAKHAMGEGQTLEEAVKFAKKHGIDYSAAGPVINFLSRTAIPFIKYPYKAVPLIAEYLVKRPLTMGKYPALLYAVDQYAKRKAGWTESDGEKADAIFDKTWMANRRKVMLPYKDDDGRTQYLDLSFFLPSEEAVGLTGNPLFSLTAELAANKDLFNNRPIWSKGDEVTGRKWFKVSDHIFKKLAPPVAPGPGAFIPYESAMTPTGGHSIDKLANAMRGRPDYLGRKRSVAKVLADIAMGLRIQPVNFKEQAGFIEKEAKEQERALKTEINKMEKELSLTTSGFDRKRIESNLERSRAALAEVENRKPLEIPGERSAVPQQAGAGPVASPAAPDALESVRERARARRAQKGVR
jgi:hypothetical protein